jgi:tungstate transport system ATP-binding protein
MTNLYQLEHITHTYAGRPVLSIEHLDLQAGVILGLSGPNGSGKSTLLKLLGFVERPAGGTIRFNGYPSTLFDDRVRGRVALLPQTSYLLRRSVFRNVAYGLRVGKDQGKGRGEQGERIRQTLSIVGLSPDLFAQRPWFALSGGEARRVALAARLVLQPEVLLLDEPTTSVDATSAQLIKEAALHAHRQWGTSLIIASHDHLWLQDICHDTIHMFRGKILGRGSKTMIFGPWRKQGDGFFFTSVAGDQVFLVSTAPPDPESSVAVIDARHIRLYATADHAPAQMARLKGTIVSLSLEKSSGNISVCLSAGGTHFTTCLPSASLSDGRLLPGSTAWLAYSPDEVQWY